MAHDSARVRRKSVVIKVDLNPRAGAAMPRFFHWCGGALLGRFRAGGKQAGAPGAQDTTHVLPTKSLSKESIRSRQTRCATIVAV